jgi:hypothetical protein
MAVRADAVRAPSTGDLEHLFCIPRRRTLWTTGPSIVDNRSLARG